MKRVFYVPLAAVGMAMFFVSCMKNDVPRCTNNSITQDQVVIDSFINKNPSYANTVFNPTYNIYMGIETPGTGSMPAADSQIVFKKETRLLNGTLVDSGTVAINPDTRYPIRLNNFDPSSADHFIFSQLRKGGSMKVIVPSSLNGLGCQPGTGRYGAVPGNSQLINTITLVDVKANQ